MPIEALLGVERGRFREPRVVVNADMRIGCDLQRVMLVELVSETHEMGVWMTFEYVHPQQWGTLYPGLERIVVRYLVRYQQLQLAIDFGLQVLQTPQPGLQKKTVLMSE